MESRGSDEKTRRSNGRSPSKLTSFVGRRQEIAETRRLFSESHIVTLTGPGGVGKTRLALQVAAKVRRTFDGGVWLVELDSIRDPALVTQTVVDSLGLCELSDRSPMAVLRESLQQGNVLLVLDNCEHVVSGVAAVVELLRFCPRLRILATSREPLGLSGETVLRVPPLSVPDPRRLPSPQQMATIESVALLVDRASSTAGGFTITEDNKRAVAEICYQLNGVPLAVELAAAQLRILSPADVARRLADQLQLLTAAWRGCPPRQQTMRSCLKWSYDLCSPQERLLWHRLSVFTGRFDLDAVEAICSGDGLAAEDMVHLVGSLVDKSILVGESGENVTRYRILDSIREYGLERLRETGEYEKLRQRHRRWYADLVARVNAYLGLGLVAWRQGRSHQGAELLKQSLRRKQETDEPLGTAWCLEALAWILADERDPQRAATLLGAADTLFRAQGTCTATPSLTAYHERCERQIRDELDDAAFQAAFDLGAGLTIDLAIAYALGEKLDARDAPVHSAPGKTPLTRREQEVAALVAQGLSNKEIAATLVISQRTAEAHVEHILVKLGFTSRTQVGVWAIHQKEQRVH